MPFTFNVYSSLLLLPFLQGILFVFLLLRRSWQEQKVSDLLLAVLLFILSVTVSFWMLGFAGWYDSHDGYTSFMFYFPFNLLLLTGPCIWFYFLSVTNTEFQFKKQHWPHFILPVAILLLYIFKFAVDFLTEFPFPKTEAFQYGTRGSLAELDKSTPVLLISYISVFFYLWKSLRVFQEYKTYLNGNFSETASLSFVWLQRMLWAVSIGIGFFFLFFLLSLFTDFMSYRISWFAYSGLGVLIYYLSINGYINRTPQFRKLQFEPEQNLLNDAKTSGEVPLTEELPANWAHWKVKFEQVMTLQRPYLNPELTLAELAALLETTPQIVSRLINSGFGQNFNDYINARRVEEVVSRIKKGDHKKHTFTSLAFDSGFNSKATFNRAFRKHTGQTPSSWVENTHVRGDL